MPATIATSCSGQMAAFLSRALGLPNTNADDFPNTNADYFDDDDGRFYERSANKMYEAGITVGCGGSKYCGNDPVTRGQMAAFLSRALNL